MKLVIIEPLEVKDEYLNNLLNSLKGIEVIKYETKPNNEDELIKRGKNADYIIIANTPLKSKILKEYKKLKFLSVAFTGLDHIDLEYCNKHNIKVMNSSGYSTNAVAELALGLILDLYRNISQFNNSNQNRNLFVGKELNNKNIGIIGTGKIGTKLIELLKPFNVNIYAYSKTHKESIKYLELNQLLKKCDIISIHVPLNKETENLLNKNNMKNMKANSIIINTARNKIINENDLIEFLETKKISGVALDVYDTNPNTKLKNMSNVILTPHIGFATEEALKARAKKAIKNIIDNIN